MQMIKSTKFDISIKPDLLPIPKQRKTPNNSSISQGPIKKQFKIKWPAEDPEIDLVSFRKWVNKLGT